MPGYKYPNIDSGATPIGSAGRAPNRKTILRKNSTRREEEEKELEPMIFEKIINEERGRKFRVHCRWQAPENKLDISLPSGAQIQEPEDFRKSKN
jgi:hypothetical protein